MLFKLETRERLGRHTHESLLSFPTKGNQFSSLKEPVRYCVSSALRPSAYARLRHHKSIFDEWTLSFPLFLFILIYLYRFWLVFSLYLLRENGAFFIVIPELSHGSLWLAVARRFVALSLGIYVIARNPNTRQRLWCTGDAINSHWRTIRDPFAESLRHAHSRRENRDEPISRNTSDRRVLRRHLENFLIYILPGLDVVSFKVIDEWMAFWLCGWEGVWPFFSLFLKPFILVETDETFIFLLSFFKRRRRQ